MWDYSTLNPYNYPRQHNNQFQATTPSFGQYQMPNNAPQQVNKLYVTSAEDALSRFANPNTITVYWLQDESRIFEVYTDFQGKKNIVTRMFEKPVETPKNDLKNDEKKIDYITRSEFDELKGKIDSLLSTKNTKKKVSDDE